jgi:hypothetical protein
LSFFEIGFTKETLGRKKKLKKSFKKWMHSFEAPRHIRAGLPGREISF